MLAPGTVVVGRHRGIHPIRRRMIDYLVSADWAHTASVIVARARFKETTARRYLEDLVALGVLDLVRTRPEEWTAREWIRERWLRGIHVG